MRLIVVFLICAGVAIADGEDVGTYIYGGTKTTIDYYPFIVSMLLGPNNYMHHCAGTIISEVAVLSAAHCFSEFPYPNQWRIRAGSSFAYRGGYIYNLRQIFIHPYNERANLNNDFAVVHVQGPIRFIRNVVQPAPIASELYRLRDNQAVWAVGWGETEFEKRPEQLRHTQVFTINQETCANHHHTVGRRITSNMMCAGLLGVGGRSTCYGDSGGPLLHQGVVVGVVSWGICGDAYYPVAFARVSIASRWIYSVVLSFYNL